MYFSICKSTEQSRKRSSICSNKASYLAYQNDLLKTCVKSCCMLKRKRVSSNIDGLPDQSSISILMNPTKRPQKYNIQLLNALKVPQTISTVSESPKVDNSVTSLLDEIMAQDDELLMTDDSNKYNGTNPKILIFAGALCKEYISDIIQELPSYKELLVFISSNLPSNSCDPIHRSDTQQCVKLASYFGILDPLGGGTYPLDYLMVIDSNNHMRCKMPIRVCPNDHYSPYQKFGVDLNKLQGLIDEQMEYFITTQKLMN